MRHIIDANTLDANYIKRIFKRADEFSPNHEYTHLNGCSLSLIQDANPLNLLSPFIQLAFNKLGGTSTKHFIHCWFSGDSQQYYEDTIKIHTSIADVVVIDNFRKCNIQQFAQNSTKASILVGEQASQQSPLKSLIDLYTIQRELRRLNDLHVTLFNNPNTPECRSLEILLHTMGNANVSYLDRSYKTKDRTRHIATFEPDAIINYPQKIVLAKQQKFAELLPITDVFYCGASSTDTRERVLRDDTIVLNQDTIAQMKPESIILHTMPIMEELTTRNDPHLKIQQQIDNSVKVCMAVLEEMIIG